MTVERLTAADVRAALKEEARYEGSKKALAKLIGVSPAFLGDIINGKREPSGKPVSYLGLKREVVYVQTTPQTRHPPAMTDR